MKPRFSSSMVHQSFPAARRASVPFVIIVVSAYAILMRTLAAILVMALGPGTVQQLSPAEGEPKEAYAIYSALVGRTATAEFNGFQAELRLVIDAKTRGGAWHGCLDKITEVRPEYKESVADYLARNKQSVVVERRFEIALPYEIVDEPIPPDPQKRRFTARYWFSRVGFNSQRDRAVLAMGYLCGGLCGAGGIRLFSKRNDQWVSEDVRMFPLCSWIS